MDGRSVANVPSEVLAEVIRRVPPMTVPVLRFVSRQWNQAWLYYESVHRPPGEACLRETPQSAATRRRHCFMSAILGGCPLALVEWVASMMGQQRQTDSALGSPKNGRVGIETDQRWWPSDACATAARANRIDTLVWLHDQQGEPLDAAVCAHAAAHGNMMMLEWALARGCEMDGRTPRYAASNGHLATLQWLCTRRAWCAQSTNVLWSAAYAGHLHVIEWALAKSFPRTGDPIGEAARGGHAHIVRWLHAHGFELNERAANLAAMRGDMELVQWIHKSGGPWSPQTCASAVGHLPMLQWLRVHGCPWDEETCKCAAEGGHLDALVWARAHGCPWDVMTARGAARNRQSHVLRWTVENGCPMDEWVCAGVASCGDLDMLEWLRERGCPWDETTCSEAASFGHLEILRWAHEQGCPWSERTTDTAARHGQLDALQWAVLSGCPWKPERCWHWARLCHSSAVRKWVEPHLAPLYPLSP